MLGGTLFAVSALVIASMPRGCIGAECAFRQGRVAGGALLMQHPRDLAYEPKGAPSYRAW